jgi:hypothetical protein
MLPVSKAVPTGNRKLSLIGRAPLHQAVSACAITGRSRSQKHMNRDESLTTNLDFDHDKSGDILLTVLHLMVFISVRCPRLSVEIRLGPNIMRRRASGGDELHLEPLVS